jgi:hypothetical protein
MVIGCLELSWRDHSDLAVQAPMVEPFDVLQSLVLDVIEPTPGSLVNQLCLVLAVERLSECVVI